MLPLASLLLACDSCVHDCIVVPLWKKDVQVHYTLKGAALSQKVQWGFLSLQINVSQMFHLLGECTNFKFLKALPTSALELEHE